MLMNEGSTATPKLTLSSQRATVESCPGDITAASFLLGLQPISWGECIMRTCLVAQSCLTQQLHGL